MKLINLTAAFTLWGAGQAAAAPPPLSVYAADPAISDVSLAPDGRTVAFLSRAGENRTLILMPAGSTTTQEAPLGRLDLQDLAWIDQDHLLLFHSVVLAASEVAPQQRVAQGLSYNIATHIAAVLLSRTPNTTGLLAGGPVDYGRWKGRPAVFTRALVAGPSFALYGIDAETGIGEPLPGAFNRTSDPTPALGTHILGAGASSQTSFNAEGWVVTPDGTPIAAQRLDPASHRSRLDVRGASGWRTVELGPDATFTASGLGRTAGTVLVKRGQDLLEVTTEGVVSPPLQPPGAQIRTLLFGGTSRLLIAACLAGESRRCLFFDDRLQRAWEKAAAPFAHQNVELISVSDDMHDLIVRTEEDGAAGAYFWVDLKTFKAEPLGDERPALTGDLVARVRTLDVKAKDGLVLRAFLTLPPGPTTKGLPLVVWVHDGPDGSDDKHFDARAQAFASRGYAVLKVNYRGSGANGMALRAAGRGEWGRRMQSDLSDAVGAATADGSVDPKRVCIAGEGYGGYAALAGVTLQSGVYRCAMGLNAVSDLPATLRLPEAYERSPRWKKVLTWRAEFTPDSLSKDALSAISPLAHAAQASAPILLIHDAAATLVSADQSRSMHGALDRAGRANRLVVLPVTEDSRFAKGRMEVLEAMLLFLSQNNPA